MASIYGVPAIARLTKKPRLVVVLGGVLGDEGKGATVDFLLSWLNGRVVVRIGSGSNPGHAVLDEFSQKHIFMQVPSGAFKRNPKTGTYDAILVLSRGMMLDPVRLGKELDLLEGMGHPHVLERLVIEPEVNLIMPYHVALNRLQEISEGRKRGSTGRGNSQSLQDVGLPETIQARDLADRAVLRRKIEFWVTKKRQIAERYLRECRPGTREEVRRFLEANRLAFDAETVFQTVWAAGQRIEHRIQPAQYKTNKKGAPKETIVIESAQAINLHPQLGTVPNTTPYDTTVKALKNGTSFEIEQITDAIIVTRAYSTSHGPRFFPTEVDGSQAKFRHLKDGSSDVIDGDWDLAFRVGWLDLVMLRNSILQTAAQLDRSKISLAVTNLDRMDSFERVKLCDYYRFAGDCSALDAAGISYEVVEGEARIMFFQAAISANQEIRDKIVPHYIEVAPGNIVTEIEKQTKTPVSIVSRGPGRQDRQFNC